ncbi:NAD-dependent protein deacetylase hst2-1 [Ceratocystis lukuohia]|uniref:NAD-dependent protein deacetylase hst2-1 n=1 Tax=Ceratocystis lukuohia TaxID=2019550 RepID=A0ABR4MPT9_9PEZI
MGQNESASLGPDITPYNLSARTLDAVAEFILQGKAKKIVVLTGAGISTAAGIPDFRSPGTGLYNNLKRLNLPYPEAVFDIDFFRKHPEPFYVLAKELYPGKFYPTISHAFITLLARKQLLSKLFTQNIDCLERRAGVSPDMIVEAHGSFATQRCIECRSDFDGAIMREHVQAGRVARCTARGCHGLIKPDIVFFGEGLPMEFTYSAHLAREADLLLVLGTSLTVYPFAGAADMPSRETPRVLFNREQVGSLGQRPDDVLELGPCDRGVRRLARLLGWEDELEVLWRDTVGEKEALRQMGVQDTWEEEIGEFDEDIVDKMAQGLGNLELSEEEDGPVENDRPGSLSYKKLSQDDRDKKSRDKMEDPARPLGAEIPPGEVSSKTESAPVSPPETLDVVDNQGKATLGSPGRPGSSENLVDVVKTEKTEETKKVEVSQSAEIKDTTSTAKADSTDSTDSPSTENTATAA